MTGTRHAETDPAAFPAGPMTETEFRALYERLRGQVPGNADSHIDALCHVIFDRTLYNGVAADIVTAAGAAELSIGVAAGGIAGRGVPADRAGPVGCRRGPGRPAPGAAAGAGGASDRRPGQ